MIKRFLFFFFIPLFAYAHNHLPYESGEQSFSGNQLAVRVFKKINKYNLMLDALQGTSYNEVQTMQVKFGTYYKLKNRQKLGLFISSQTGNRHSDDWIKDPIGGDWIWKDTSERQEQVVHLTYGKRFVPSFRTPLVLETKGEYQTNLYNQHQIFIFRPGLNYFLLKKAQPLISFHMATPIYIAMNFGQTTPYKYGAYLGMLYHFSKQTRFGFNISATEEKWTESTDIIEKTADTYSINQALYSSKLELIFQF